MIPSSPQSQLKDCAGHSQHCLCVICSAHSRLFHRAALPPDQYINRVHCHSAVRLYPPHLWPNSRRFVRFPLTQVTAETADPPLLPPFGYQTKSRQPLRSIRFRRHRPREFCSSVPETELKGSHRPALLPTDKSSPPAIGRIGTWATLAAFTKRLTSLVVSGRASHAFCPAHRPLGSSRYLWDAALRGALAGSDTDAHKPIVSGIKYQGHHRSYLQL